MNTKIPTGISWDWLFRRNVSLLQLWLWTDGLKGKGFSPELDFHLVNFLGVFVEGRGNYYFFDSDETTKKSRQIRAQFLAKPFFASRLHAKADALYRSLEGASRPMNEKGLSGFENERLLEMFQGLRKAFAAAPILTMGAYGVEACVSSDSPLIKFLAAKLGKNPSKEEFLAEVNLLSMPEEPTSAFLERKNFLEVAVAFKDNGDESALDRHIADFQWVHTEYVSPRWPREIYFQEMKAIAQADPRRLLREHVEKFESQLKRKRELLEQLHPPQNVLDVIASLQEFMREFDWSKAYYCKTFLNWWPFVSETARRMGCSDVQVLFHTPDEIEGFLETGRKVEKSEIEKRMRGFVLLMRDEVITLVEDDIKEIAHAEKVYDVVFGKKEGFSELKGTVASVGHAAGRVKVVQSVADLKKLEKGDVLVTYMTTMELTQAFHKASAIVTDEGGLFSHAAIVSREFGLPCVVGTKKATRVFRDGDVVEVDAERGIVRKL